jgi:hypothetical protein
MKPTKIRQWLDGSPMARSLLTGAAVLIAANVIPVMESHGQWWAAAAFVIVHLYRGAVLWYEG